MPYVKLDCGITRSTIWMEDAETVRLWIYLLAESDSMGVVTTTLPIIARDNLMAPSRVREILEKFSEPDPDSRDPDNDGRRIVVQREPEWAIEILNYLKYRGKDFTNAEKQRAYRERKKAQRGVTKSNALRNKRYGVTSHVTQAEAEAEVQDLSPKGERPLPSQEELTESSTPKILADLKDVCTRLKPTFPKVFSFKNAMLKQGKNERAILHALCRCAISQPENPWAYCSKILGVENGNYNESDWRKTQSAYSD